MNFENEVFGLTRISVFALFVGDDLIKCCHKCIILFMNLEIQLFINLAEKNAKRIILG